MRAKKGGFIGWPFLEASVEVSCDRFLSLPLDFPKTMICIRRPFEFSPRAFAQYSDESEAGGGGGGGGGEARRMGRSPNCHRGAPGGQPAKPMANGEGGYTAPSSYLLRKASERLRRFHMRAPLVSRT